MLLQIQLKIKQETVYTNASSILLEGTATPEAVLTLNSRVLKTDLYGRFSFNAPLKEGENKFVFQLKDEMNNSIEKTLTVYRDSEKPEIKILSPTKNPYYTKNKSVEIRLQTEIGSKVTFQNNPMTETSPGIFQIVYELQQGNNTLKISVKDKAGNQSETVLEIVLYKTAYYIQLKIGSNRAVVNGKTYELDVPPQVLSGRTVVPLRFIAESFGAEVEWVAETKEIQIRLYQ